MLKKLSLLVVAFAIGAMVSLSIQACADDYNEIPEQNKTESSSNSSGTSAWKNDGIESIVSYNENGQMSQQINYTYNSKGWVTKVAIIGYANGSKSCEQTTTYTYSSSGDIRYGNFVQITYLENGQIYSTTRSSNEYRLRK